MAVNATAIWRVRPSGNNANGGGFDPGIASPGTDRSQQDAAFATFNGGAITATTAGVTNVITLVGYTATAADIANCLHITGGTNFLTGWYFITAQGGTTWTLDRNCTSGAGAAMTGNMGGGWADFWTNTTGAAAIIVPGNIIYILGSGIPNPASYSFDYVNGTSWSPPASSSGKIVFANDPSTPGYKVPPDTTGGMPCIQVTASGALINIMGGAVLKGLWAVWGVAGTGYLIGNMSAQPMIYGCVFDQFGRDVYGNNDGGGKWFGNEIFSSVAGAAGIRAAVYINQGSQVVVNNIHDCIGNGINVDADTLVYIEGNVVAKCNLHGVVFKGTSILKNNTIDGNLGNGVTLTSLPADAVILNNIITNHVGAGTYGISCGTGTAAGNDLLRLLIDYQVYYNNTNDLNNLNYGVHDTRGGSNPYVGQATENYTLA